jgi:FkbM family methyltransferase
MPSRDCERQVTTRDGIHLVYRRNRGDIQSVREIFCDRHYRIPSSIRPRTLVDLGANIGLASVWFARRYGVERVVAVEPVGANAAIACRNLACNGVEGEVLEAAIGPSRGRVVFELADASNLGRVATGPEARPPAPAAVGAGPASSPRGRDGAGGPGEGLIEVEMITMHDVLARLGAGADLVKLDIEGGEDALLQGDVSWLDHVGAIVAELHPEVVDLGSIAERLEGRGLRHLPPSSLWPGSMAMFVRPSHVRPVPEEPALRRLLEEAGRPPVPDPEIERLLFPGGRA